LRLPAFDLPQGGPARFAISLSPHHPGGGAENFDIDREAFNRAFAAHAGEPNREKRAPMIACAATSRPAIFGWRAS
jgi:hypothetical protein